PTVRAPPAAPLLPAELVAGGACGAGGAGARLEGTPGEPGTSGTPPWARGGREGRGLRAGLRGARRLRRGYRGGELLGDVRLDRRDFDLVRRLAVDGGVGLDRRRVELEVLPGQRLHLGGEVEQVPRRV